MYELEQDSSEEYFDGEAPAESKPSQPAFGKRKLNSKVSNAKKKIKPNSNKSKMRLQKPPTADELSNLEITENLYNDSMLRLQIDELIKETSIKVKRHEALKNWLETTFKNTLKLMENEEFFLSELQNVANSQTKRSKLLSSFATNYKCPFSADQDLRISLPRPEIYESFGLYDNNSLAGPNLEACINVKMPRECFNVKDFLNNRYLVKRFYYLAYIALKVPSFKTQLELFEGNNLLPILHLQPTKDKKLIIKVFATPCEDYFKISRLLPNQNNLKKDLFETKIEDLKLHPTPFYNSALAHDFTLSANWAFVKATLSDYPTIHEGLKLVGIWLKQRELDRCFTPNLAMYFMVYLVLKKKINKLMSSYQVVRNFWSFLVGIEGFISLAEVSDEILRQFKGSFSVVFVDKTGCYNLASFLTMEMFKKVKFECSLALKLLGETRLESFHSLFLSKLPFVLQYDLVLDVTKALPLQEQLIVSNVEKAKYAGFKELHAVGLLTELLQRGLNKRVVSLVPQIVVDYPNEVKKVLFGVNLERKNAFNFIELGPSLNDTVQAEEFRQFWGHLATNRRFQDGSTNVAVYFKTSTIRGKRGIVKRIIKYLFAEKLNLPLRLFYDEFEELLLNKKVVSSYPLGTNEEASSKIIAVADELGQKLRSTEMSLSITGIQGVSEAFKYTQVFPPIACKFKPDYVTEVRGESVVFSENKKKIGMLPRYVEPLELVIQLEHSSKWPNNLEAVRHIKTFIYLEISKMLLNRHQIVSTVTKDYLEVLYQGLVFHYTLYVVKEVALMKKELSQNGSTAYVNNQLSLVYEKRLNVLPKVNAALKGLQMQFPSFGPGTALTKRWLRAHLIDQHHLSDVTVELCNAALYLNNGAFAESCSPQISFLRLLKFFSEFQWELQPLIVNFNEDISKEDLSELEEKFIQNRTFLQPLYIVTPYDQGQSLFTTPNPSREVLCRVRQLAKAALELTVSLSIVPGFNVKDLFRPNMEGYHLLIHLKPLLNPRRHEAIDTSNDSKIVLEAYEKNSNEKIPINGFDPVALYLKDLRESYSEFAIFFHDPYGGHVVGVLWNPETEDFKVAQIGGRRVSGDKLELNKEALIEDFYLLGKGVVKWIEKL
ncbi:nucleolar protein 6 [Euwallacea similis]|uniref:nucleolar protein 6 n=1 Tax=Euwallacea similis TaxID=1736056 RepID=UPI00344DBE07